jgi:flagellar biogenesis protein FliO
MKHFSHQQQNSRFHAQVHRAFVVACLGMMLLMARDGVAQQTKNHETPDGMVSKKEQLVRRLEALRAAKSSPAVQRAVHVQNPEPKELFLDLTSSSSASSSPATSEQAAAATLDVSMTSSPAQVVMRAVAWISIVLCVCCLIILGARRWQRERGLLPTTTSRSRVMETLSLGPGRTVSLIEMHGYRALVATDAGGIRSLVLAPASFEDSLMHDVETQDEV